MKTKIEILFEDFWGKDYELIRNIALNPEGTARIVKIGRMTKKSFLIEKNQFKEFADRAKENGIEIIISEKSKLSYYLSKNKEEIKVEDRPLKIDNQFLLTDAKTCCLYVFNEEQQALIQFIFEFLLEKGRWPFGREILVGLRRTNIKDIIETLPKDELIIYIQHEEKYRLTPFGVIHAKGSKPYMRALDYVAKELKKGIQNGLKKIRFNYEQIPGLDHMQNIPKNDVAALLMDPWHTGGSITDAYLEIDIPKDVRRSSLILEYTNSISFCRFRYFRGKEILLENKDKLPYERLKDNKSTNINEVTEVTRRNIIDFIVEREYPFYGRLELLDFLEKIWDLESMPSTDSRFKNAKENIWKHVINNNDWEDIYLLSSILNLLGCSDKIFLKFLETCLHPVILADKEKVLETSSVFNKYLEKDGYKLEESSKISGKPVYTAIKVDIKSQELDEESYDVVLSFAGEDRSYVENVAAYLKELNVKVFYDRYEEVTLWGKDLPETFDKIYRGNARYCVMFISKHYADKMWTTHERRSALAKAIQEKQEYILPVRFDNTEIPGIRPTIGYVDLRKRTPKQLSQMIIEKLGKVK